MIAPAEGPDSAAACPPPVRDPAARTPLQVVQDHLDAVRTLDPRAMSADYADDAVLERPDRIWRGRGEIEAYFQTVASRLAGGRVEFLGIDPQPLEVRWRIVGGPGDGVRGRDSYQIVAGRIALQRVRLDDRVDF